MKGLRFYTFFMYTGIQLIFFMNPSFGCQKLRERHSVRAYEDKAIDGNQVSAKAGRGFCTKLDLGIAKCHFAIGAASADWEWKG